MEDTSNSNKNGIIVIVIGIAILGAWGAVGGPGIGDHKKQVDYPVSADSYSFVNKRVGCASTLSDDKKKDIFEQDYQGHRMEWAGTIVSVSSDDVAINIDGKGIQDLSVDFQEPGTGYHLVKGRSITLSFVMRHAGGCFLPFTGDLGKIVHK